MWRVYRAGQFTRRYWRERDNMAVGYHTTKRTRRIQFISNVSYEGVDYGPDYEQAEVEMPPHDAFRFVHEGRAVYADEGPTDAVNEKTVAEVEPGTRRGGGRK